MKKFLLFVFAFSFFIFTSKAQMQISPETNMTQLLNNFILSGVSASNIVYTGDTNAIGSFTGGSSTNLGMNEGIILSDGLVNGTPAIDTSAINFASTSTNFPGDSLLGSYTSDAAVLEFDLVPAGNLIEFQYVLGSEEYPEFVCSVFADLMGFFLTGPNPSGGNYLNKNIALVPNTTVPVSINSINPGIIGQYGTYNACVSLTNSQYYINNQSGTTIIYDGLTTVLTATASVIPDSSYHLKIAIADNGDHLYDSGLFLKAQSMKSYTLVGLEENKTHNFSIAPNPLASGSKLSLNLAHPGKVKISITDISGKTVYQTEKSFGSAGPQQISLDEFNNNHTSGIYLMKVETDDFTEMQKIVK